MGHVYVIKNHRILGYLFKKGEYLKIVWDTGADVTVETPIGKMKVSYEELADKRLFRFATYRETMKCMIKKRLCAGL